MKKFIPYILSFSLFALILYALLLSYNERQRNKSHLVSLDQQIKFELIRPGDEKLFPQYAEIVDHTPNTILKHFGTQNGKMAFDVIYHFDEWGLRGGAKTPGAREHLIVGGCSMVFGAALRDEDTLTAHLENDFPKANILNFSQSAGGLHTQLRALDLIPLRKYVTEEKGMYLYLFYDDHVNRWVGAPSYLTYARKEKVFYEVQMGKLRRMQVKDSSAWKKFEESRKAGLEEVYLRTHAVTSWEKHHLDSFMVGVKELRRQYLKLFPQGSFIFVIYPLYLKHENILALMRRLEEEQIPFMNLHQEVEDYMFSVGKSARDFRVAVDGHPNGDFNKQLAKILARKLSQFRTKNGPLASSLPP